MLKPDYLPVELEQRVHMLEGRNSQGMPHAL